METFYVTKVSHHYFLPFMEEEIKQNLGSHETLLQNPKFKIQNLIYLYPALQTNVAWTVKNYVS